MKLHKLIHKVASKLKYSLSLNILNYLWFILRDINPKPIINGFVKIKCKGRLRFGKNVKINSGKNYNIIGGDIRTNLIITKDAELVIGNNVGISNSSIYCTNSIKIEDNVLVGGGCKFYDTDFHSIEYEDRIAPYINNMKDSGAKSKPIYIGKGAWIGGHSIILKGVQIGEKSIIAAGSVVTRNIPGREIWGGNPAEFIRKL